MMKLQIVLLLLCVAITHEYKILGLFGHPGKSHFDAFEPLLKALAVKGHELTIVSYHPQKQPVPNIIDVSLKTGHELEEGTHIINVGNFTGVRWEKYLTVLMLSYFGSLSCEMGLTNPKLQDLIKSKPKFDLIITEFFNTQCFLGVAHKFKAPIIGISSCSIQSWHDAVMAIPSNPAYIPNNFMPFTTNMNFFERVENTVLNVFHHIMFRLLMASPSQSIARKHLGNDIPDLNDIVYNVSVMLVNNHFTFSVPRPMVPGYIEVGGMHLGKQKKLPQNIEKWINESSHGVIYFSLGSMIKGHTFPEEKRQMFLRAFSRLPQRVLWKWETETMPGKPDNVMLQKWMPQFDILCHPNVKAFIAHGGLLGTTEAVHCGVPMVIMPQFGDQFTNAKAVEASGGGVILDFTSLNEESIYDALTTVLEPNSNKKAKELSARFRDRPLPPLDTAIYWVEYVARHGGAPHLRTAAVGMPLYKYLLLDVFAFLAVVLFVASYVMYFVTKAVFKRIFKSKASDKVKKS